MANSRGSLAVTRSVRQWITRQVNQTTVDVARMWRVVNLDDLEGSVRTFSLAATARVAAQQETMGDAADAYIARFLSSELGDTVGEAGVQVAPGRTVDGRPVSRLFQGALPAVAMSLTASRDPQTALAAGENHALRAARNECMDAFRTGEQQAIEGQGSQVSGWRRDTAGGCGVCLALADGAVHDLGDLPETHPSCMCIIEPVAAGVADTHPPQTGQDIWSGMSQAAQDRLFEGKGGAQKAAMIRGGRVALADLVVRRRSREWRDYVEERPLAAL